MVFLWEPNGLATIYDAFTYILKILIESLGYNVRLKFLEIS